MAVSVAGTATPGTTTCTIPAHNIGDLILIISFRDGSNSTPTLAAGFTQLDTVTSNSAGTIVGYKIATATNDTSGTWANALQTDGIVFTGNNTTTPIGGHAITTGSSTTVSYPALTMTNATGSSWVAGLAAHRSINTTLETPPTGMTNRVDDVTTGEVVINDTNGGVASWSLQTVSVGGTSSGWAGATVEILAASGAQTISPTAIASTAALGSVAVSSVYTVSPTGIASTASMGSPTLTPGGVTLSPTGLASTAALGTVALSSTIQISATAINSTSSLGSPTLSPGTVTISATGIDSTAAVGSPTVASIYTVSPVGIAVTTILGSPTLTPGGVTISPTSITSTATLGSPSIDVGQVISPASIASTLALGSVALSSIITLSAASIASAVAFGTPIITPGSVTISPQGISSSVLFGLPTMQTVAPYRTYPRAHNIRGPRSYGFRRRPTKGPKTDTFRPHSS